MTSSFSNRERELSDQTLTAFSLNDMNTRKNTSKAGVPVSRTLQLVKFRVVERREKRRMK